MRLYQAIHAANEAGRFGLILYTVPNFPDPQSFDETVALIDQSPFVSILESTVPVSSGFSAHANETIVAAHRIASRSTKGGAWTTALRRPHQPQLCVLYRATVEELGYAGFLREYRTLFNGVLLEWDEPDSEPYVEPSAAADVELVQ